MPVKSLKQASVIGELLCGVCICLARPDDAVDVHGPVVVVGGERRVVVIVRVLFWRTGNEVILLFVFIPPKRCLDDERCIAWPLELRSSFNFC